MPRWVVGTLLSFSAILFLTGAFAKLEFNQGLELFLPAILLFIPCYIAMYMDVAKRRLPYHWNMLLLLLPFLGVYVYFLASKRKV